MSEPQGFDLEVDLPMPGGLKVTTERPYRILIVSDLAGSEKGSLSGPLQDGIVELRPETFDAVMAAACPGVHYSTTDPLLPGNVMAEVQLKFDSLRAFDPKNLALRIPALRGWMDVRDSLVGRLKGQVSADAMNSALSRAAGSDAGLAWLPESIKWSPAAKAADTDVLDGLLGQFDMGGESGPTPPPKTAIGSAIAAAAGGPSLPAAESSAVRRTLAELDRRMSAWLTAVLHAPQIQSIESAWRSLAFLISRTDFRKGVRLSVLHAPRAQLTQRLVSLLIDPVFDQGADAPDLIVVDHAFGNSAPDLEALDELAQHGASLPAVVLAGLSPGFFGVKQAWQIATLPPLVSMLDQYQFAKWKNLRGQPYARALAVVFGRCLLRAPYERDGAGELDFAYREERTADKDFLWANGTVAAACAATGSVARTGWPTAMVGYVHGRVEGFATAEGGPKGDKKFGPTDAPLAKEKLEEMAAAGVNAVTSFGDHNDALVWNGMTAARPHRMDHDALLEVSLPYQLFAGRLAVLLLELKEHLSGMATEKVVPFVYQHVRDWLQFTGETSAADLLVQTRPAEDDPKATQLAVTVTPPQNILPGGIPVVMGYRL